jgi:signal transduction histidine kinase/CheY-like chemotaxis protein
MAAKPNVAAPARACLALLVCVATCAAAAVAPSPTIESLHVLREDRAQALDASGPLLRLQSGDRDIRLRVSPAPGPATGVQAPQWIWLQGHDAGWVALAPSGEHAYPRLPPGRLRLRVAHTGPAGTRVERPGLTLLVGPPWWRSQAAFAAAGAGLLGLATWAVVVRRARARRRRAWQLAQERQQLAEQHSEAKSRFLATLGHEIRTPMTGVLGMAELLQGSALDATQRHQVDAIERAGRHLLRLVNDALDLARIEAGKLVLEHAPFELAPLLQEVAGLLRPLAQAKALALSLQCDPGLPTALRGDGTRLRQILFNLGHNAIKFCDRGEVRLALSWREGSGLTLRVSDTGPGLGEEQKARLFRWFEPGAGRDGEHGSGSGLGLAICRELALAMGGGIQVRSEPGQGAEFAVVLPLEAATSAPPAAPAPGGGRARTPLSLLLVEDDAVVADVVRGLLERQGHRVVHAPHGLAALAELDAGSFDLALLDLDLPGIDGLALARLVRARGQPLPMLALTARADPDAEPAARAAGMAGFLRKPVTGEMLAEAIAGTRA